MVFGRLTGLDPRSLGDNECSAYEWASPLCRFRRCSRSHSISSRHRRGDAGADGSRQTGQLRTLPRRPLVTMMQRLADETFRLVAP